ncbi:OLC1v1002863C2 [Oldenlandia corymbosa var. corymbosa]|uniref:OLC1v1002863C2 n=1 Tax=Oldenlandia corymbosa var. corymbosa TaxID=529605 RepID=A0AAV1D8R2_OLDCO|nr:OLC1v1002863C2 [Oldenlandia corymbosa var. corymbosa]
MATPFPASSYASSSWVLDKRPFHPRCFVTPLSKLPLGQNQKTHLCLSPVLKPSSKRFNFFVKAEDKNESSSSVAVMSEEESQRKDVTSGVDSNAESDSKSEESTSEAKSEVDSDAEAREKERQQELDWKTDEDFKKFMGNPSIEAAIKLEKKMTDRKLKELDRERSDNPIVAFFNKLARDNLSKEKERLEKVEQTFKALDLNKLKSCFGFDTFFATDVRRFGDGGIFIGNLRKPIEEAIPKLEKKLSEAAGTEVVVWFMEEKTDDITKQACVVQPKAEMDLQFESTNLSNAWGYFSAIALCVTTFGTIALTSGFFIKPDATWDDYFRNVVPLFGGFLTILGVSEIATRLTAARYGVKLSPSFLVPSNWTGCLGVVNNYESLLPNKKALFDIPVARTASAYLTSLVLTVAAFIADGSVNGGDNALYIRPQFFFNNPLLSFIQYVIGPYTDDLGNVLPYAVEGVGVPCDPLAFAGLLGQSLFHAHAKIFS